MQYRLVYDVLNDGFPWFGVVFATVPLLLAVASFLEILKRVQRKQSPSAPGHRVSGLEAAPFVLVLVLFLFTGSVAAVFASLTYDGFMQRQRCKEWARAGKYEITEGTVTDYQYRKAGPAFRVAGLSFDLLDRSGGFTGRFNVPGATQDSLREGLPIRLAHQEGYILRVEIAR
jgi:hypothetical protein